MSKGCRKIMKEKKRNKNKACWWKNSCITRTLNFWLKFSTKFCALYSNKYGKRMLSRHRYPNNFLDRCIQQFLNRKYVVMQQRDAPAEPSSSPKYISLQLPHLGSIYNNIWQEFSSFIRHKAVVNVKLCCFQSTRKLQSWFSIKDGQALLNRFNVV